MHNMTLIKMGTDPSHPYFWERGQDAGYLDHTYEFEVSCINSHNDLPEPEDMSKISSAVIAAYRAGRIDYSSLSNGVASRIPALDLTSPSVLDVQRWVTRLELLRLDFHWDDDPRTVGAFTLAEGIEMTFIMDNMRRDMWSIYDDDFKVGESGQDRPSKYLPPVVEAQTNE